MQPYWGQETFKNIKKLLNDRVRVNGLHICFPNNYSETIISFSIAVYSDWLNTQHMYSVMSDICCFILFRGWICASVSPSVASLRRPITSQIKDAWVWHSWWQANGEMPAASSTNTYSVLEIISQQIVAHTVGSTF